MEIIFTPIAASICKFMKTDFLRTSRILLGAVFFLLAPATRAQGTETLPEIVVSGKSASDLRIKKDAIHRVESLSPSQLQKKQAQSFAQMIDNEKGVDTQTSCAFCGAKRITINGLKGEHTTILVDGLPLHSTVSGFYGVEAIPLEGIDSVDIYRGAGAALTAPESIGGAINILTREIVTNTAEGRLVFSNDGQKNFSVLGTRKINEHQGLLLGVQYGEILPVDIDKNGISEQPRQTTQSVLAKWTHKISETKDLSLRLSYARLKTIGGSMFKTELDQAVPFVATSSDFINNDVRQKYIGDDKKITDNVNLDRFELASIYRQQLDADSSLKFSLGGAFQDQKAIYSHGYDYDNKDQLWVLLLEYQHAASENHIWTLGVDTKNQFMDSSSRSLYSLRSPPLQQDDLRFQSVGAYAQDTWFVDENNEISLVLRLDNIKTHWLDMNRELDRTVIAPRIFYKHIHGPVLTSRFAAGFGYRPPLTLFESQHGTDHNGFVLDIQELETAQSLVYSLAGQRQDDFFEVGTHITRLENMAYGVDLADLDAPTRFVNADEVYTISALDLSYGRRFSDTWNIEGLLESFHYPSGYKEKLPVAAIETRFSLSSNFTWGTWSATQKINVIGSRNLSAYGYGGHYNIAYKDEDPLSPTFGSNVVSDQKWQKAPTFATLDLIFEHHLQENLKAGFSVLNVFDYTQTSAGDSPTTWDLHGDHFHLDNFHIWGPLRGRQFFVSLQGSWE